MALHKKSSIFRFLVQRVYLRERPHDVPDQEKFLWWIPIVLVKETNPDFYNYTPTAWMRKERQIELKDMPDGDHFIIVNPEEIGNHSFESPDPPSVSFFQDPSR